MSAVINALNSPSSQDDEECWLSNPTGHPSGSLSVSGGSNSWWKWWRGGWLANSPSVLSDVVVAVGDAGASVMVLSCSK